MKNLQEIYKDVPDGELIDKVVSGEINLYELVVRRYNDYLYKVGRSYGYEHSDVEDLMQETYVKAYVHLKDFERRSSLKTWLVKIMLHQCYHKRRKGSFLKEKPASEDIEKDNGVLYEQKITNGVKTVQNLELKKVIEQAISRLPEKYRMVFTLRELTGLSTAETAEALNLTESNVKVRLSRAKEKLQREIEKSYSPAEVFEFNLIYCDGMVNRVMDTIKKLG